MFNTDQGTLSTSWELAQVLQDRGVGVSMASKGRYPDSLFIERL